MAQIIVPMTSPFGQEARGAEYPSHHLQSYQVADQIASLSRELNNKLARYDGFVKAVKDLQEALMAAPKPEQRALKAKLRLAEKSLMGSRLPLDIRQLREEIATLHTTLKLMLSE